MYRSAVFVPFCSKIFIAIHDLVLSAYLGGVEFKMAPGLLTLIPEIDRNFVKIATVGGCQMYSCSTAFVFNTHFLFLLQKFLDGQDVTAQTGAMNFGSFWKN
jgi:hypothetical protein